MNTRLPDRLKQSRFTTIDIAALLVFIAVWVYYIITVRYGICTADESYYWTVPQRLAHGDRLLVDEWCVGQFFPLFLYLPYKIFVAIRGGTAGIILFSRYLFLAANAVFYWAMYVLLRAYRWQALLATLLFSFYIPLFIFSCSYYTMGIRLLMLVCIVLFLEKKQPAVLLLTGVLLSCAVLNQPGFAFLYFGFTVLVWIRFLRQRKNKRFLDDFAFCLDVRTWKYITLGVAVCAASFLGWLIARSGLSNILRFIPYNVSTDPEYDFSAGGNVRGFFLQKLQAAAQGFGLYCLIPALAVVVLAIVYACGLPRREREAARRILFGAACALWVLSCVQTMRISYPTPHSFFFMYPAPMQWFGLVCFLLCEKKNKRFLLFWTVSLCASLCVDFLSDIAISIASPISYIADLVFITDLLRELCQEPMFKKPACLHRRRTAANRKNAITHRKHATSRRERVKMRKKRNVQKPARTDLLALWCARAACVCFAVWFAFVFLIECPSFPERFNLSSPLLSLPYVCTRGPWRSLHVSSFIGEDYDRHLTDIDAIKESGSKNLFVCGLSAELYLYADLPYSAYCSWEYRDTPYMDRQVLYWKLHPDRLPECIYVPVDLVNNTHYGSAEDQLAWIREHFDPLCEYTAEQGQGGFILYVSQWHLPEK